MVVYAFYIFDRHAACIYRKSWAPSGQVPSAPQQLAPASTPSTAGRPASGGGAGGGGSSGAATTAAADTSTTHDAVSATAQALSEADNARLVFGAVYSLRNMVRKLGGDDDAFVSYRTGEYKLHYYETPTALKFVMLTDTRTNNLRIVLHQIYVGLYVEYVVKNPLSPVEHPDGVGVYNEMFEMGLETFINGALQG